VAFEQAIYHLGNMPVTHGVAGSGPVHSALKIKELHQKCNPFLLPVYHLVYTERAKINQDRYKNDKKNQDRLSTN
jgi:hypothetical protein